MFTLCAIGRVVLPVVVACAAVGCRKGTPERAEPPVRSERPPPSASAPSFPPAGPPGWAYLRAEELVGIDPSGKVATIPIKKGRLHALRRGSDGKAYVVVDDAPRVDLFRLDGAALRPVATLPKCAMVSETFDVRGDRLAIRCEAALHERSSASGGFTEIPLPESNVSGDAVWIAEGGGVWYGTSAGLYERKGAAWSRLSTGTTSWATPPSAFIDGEGGVYAIQSGRLVRAAQDKLEVVREARALGGGGVDLVPAANGLFGSWSAERGVALHTIDGQVRTVATKAWLSHGQLDDTGRGWVVNDGQLEIVDATSGVVTTVPMGSYPELDHLVRPLVVVLGAGPAAPASHPVRRSKRITGRITVDGKPLGEADLEICPRSTWVYSGGTPCGGAAKTVVFATKTDAKGGFAFDDVPVGHYYMHYKAADAEKWSIDSRALEPIRDNAVSNVGTLAYATRAP